MLEVMLNPGLSDGGRWACLRPLCGKDEAVIDDCSDLEANRLLDRLLVQAPGTRVGPGTVCKLAVADRDRLLAALYRHHYGERVEGSLECRSCGASFDMTFELAQLTSNMDRSDGSLATGPDSEGLYTLPDGRRFRLPTSEDQRSVVGLQPETAATTLLERCVVEGHPATDRESLEAAMAAVGATLDIDLDAKCPRCGAEHQVRFDIRAHLLGALALEKTWLVHEVHMIATAYGWNLAEILGLSRESRRAYVRLIEADRASRRRRSP